MRIGLGSLTLIGSSGSVLIANTPLVTTHSVSVMVSVCMSVAAGVLLGGTMFQVTLHSEMPDPRVARIEAYASNPSGHRSSEPVAFVQTENGVVIAAGREDTSIGRVGMEAIELSMNLAVGKV